MSANAFVFRPILMRISAVANTLIRGRSVYLYIRVLPQFSFKINSNNKLISKETSRAEPQYINIHFN